MNHWYKGYEWRNLIVQAELSFFFVFVIMSDQCRQLLPILRMQMYGLSWSALGLGSCLFSGFILAVCLCTVVVNANRLCSGFRAKDTFTNCHGRSVASGKELDFLQIMFISFKRSGPIGQGPLVFELGAAVRNENKQKRDFSKTGFSE